MSPPAPPDDTETDSATDSTTDTGPADPHPGESDPFDISASPSERDAPPSWRRAAAIVLGAVAVVFLGYALLLAQQVLLGLVAFGCLLALATAAWFGHRSDVARRVATWVVVLAVALYGLLARQFPLGVIAAATVYLVAWLTGPRSPWGGD